MDCSGCLKPIKKEEEYILCKENKCNKTYHALCLNTSNLSPEQILSWKCPDCHCKSKKGGDNSQTPVRGNENVTLRNKTTRQVPNDISPTASDEGLLPLATEIRLLRQTMLNMQNEIYNRLDTLSNRLSDFDTRIQSLEHYKEENMMLRADMEKLQQQFNKHSQTSLRNELEIVGLQELPNENPHHIALTIAQKIGVDISDQDLDYASRVGPRRRRGDSQNQDSNQTTRPLVVSFTRKVKKDEFLKQAKLRRNLDSSQIVASGLQTKIYFNERLTSHNRQLFRAARNWTNVSGYKYCWTRNGSIFVRKREARDGSPPILIESEKDLENLLRLRPSQQLEGSSKDVSNTADDEKPNSNKTLQ